MITLISGSRSIETLPQRISQMIVELDSEVICGDAPGVDALVISLRDVTVYGAYMTVRHRGKRSIATDLSYKQRDQKLVRMADQVIAIWDGKSPGTKAVIEYARSLGKAVEVLSANRR